jgi:hypothetical protein
MSKIIEIENALSRINGDNFQEFCNHYLYYLLNPNTIDPIGSVIGKEKSRKGIPDSYFTTKNGELIFAEYTTQEKIGKKQSFFNKLKSDINNCFDQEKTTLKPNEINKVILCYTSRINPKERKELKNLCEKYNPHCKLELIGIRDLSYAVFNYPFLSEYISVTISTGQIQNPSNFIADYEKTKLSTPLSNTFHGRKQEIEDGLKKIGENNVLLIHGNPGTGKSKYAIELAKQYSNSNQGFTFLCIGNKGLSIWEDLKTFIIKDKKYILLVDDANRLAQNYQLILNLLHNAPNGNIKVIVTVRDYALSQVKEISKDYIYSSIEIKEFTKDDIKEIIKSKDFNIEEPPVIERILNIARGNARLAIMSAKVAVKSTNILQLNDASQIYDEYFNPIFKEVQILNEPITQKALVLISFFGRIDKENRDFCDSVFLKLGIDENQFWEICYILNENELVDLFEQHVVKISDQIFSTYIFYKIVIDLEKIKFTFFLDNYHDYENRIKDTIIPVLNTFNYKKIEVNLKPIIVRKWNEISSQNNYEKSLKFLDLFWFYLSSQLLVFLKKHIDNIEKQTTKNYRYNIEPNEFSYGPGNDIEMLSRFKYLEPPIFKDALELLFFYGLEVPDKMPALIYLLNERFCFTRFGYMYGDYIQHAVLDFLLEKVQSSKDKLIFENILLIFIPHYLKIEYREDEGDGRQLTLYTFHLWASESIISFRQKCFEYLLMCENKSIVLKTLQNLNIFEYKDSNEIYEYDIKYIFSLINKYFSPEEFEDCYIFQKLIEDLDILKLSYPKELKNKFKNKLYRLTQILKSDRQRRKELSWQEEEKLHKKELVDYCKNFRISDYFCLLENVDLILKKAIKSNIEWQYFRALDIIFGDIAKKDCNLFLEVLNKNFTKHDLHLNYVYIFNSYFKFNQKHYYELFQLISNLRIEIKLDYYFTLEIKYVSKEHYKLFYSNLLKTLNSIENRFSFWDLTFISKFAQNEDESNIYIEVLNILLSKINTDKVNISFGAVFIEKCLSFEDIPLNLITEAYLFTNKYEQHFDYKNEIFKKLVERDYKVLFEFLDFKSKDRISYHDLIHEDFEFLWKLDNYQEIINAIFNYFIEYNAYHFSEKAINAFFPKNKVELVNKAIDFLRSIIVNHFDNDKYIEVVFNVICYSYPNSRDEFLSTFLKLNKSFDLFKKLELVRRGHSFSGSYIPILENDKLLWQRILSLIQNIPNGLDYIEHKDYVDKEIYYCDLRMKQEMKREFLDDFR